MKNENCFGIIPVIQDIEGWRVFMVLHKKGNYWGFPKGHLLCPNESPKACASRELREETGMKIVSYLNFPSLFHSYSFERAGEWIEKKVQYFLAEVEENFLIASSEVIKGQWIRLNHLMSYATFESEKKLFQQLIDLLPRSATY